MLVRFTYLSCCSVFLLFFLNCSKKNDNAWVEENYLLPVEKVILVEEYANNAIEILSRHKEGNLQIVLPNIIYDQVMIYDNLIDQYEKKQVYSSSEFEFRNYKEELDLQALESLVVKDIEMNLAYGELLSEIEELNITYSQKFNIPIADFESYFDVDNIILSEEVLLKITEFSADERQRIKNTKDDLYADLAMEGGSVLINLIPLAGPIATGTLRAVNIAMKSLKHGKKAIPLASKVGSQTGSLTNKVGAINKVSQDLSRTTVINQNGKMVEEINSSTLNILTANSEKMSGGKFRNELSKFLGEPFKKSMKQAKELKASAASSSIGGNLGDLGEAVVYGVAMAQTIDSLNSLEPVTANKIKKSKDFFRSIENKLEGRVGDYSDGILAVHLQNVREIIKRNQKYLNENYPSDVIKH